MKDRIDLHVHSTYSDGSYDPEDLVKKYSKEGYTKIAITDHDGIGGVAAAIAAGEKAGLEVIPGIEFSTDYDGHECHLLGYGFDIKNDELNKTLKRIWQYRIDRNKILIEKLNQEGFQIDIDELSAMSKGGYVGKPNIARLMVKHGYIKDPKEAFTAGKFLEAPEIKAIKRERIMTSSAIALIRNAGGVPVLAHPIKLKWFGKTDSVEYWKSLEAMIIRLKRDGLGGMECYYPEHSDLDTTRYVELAEKYDLIITRGSDFHGEDLKRG